VEPLDPRLVPMLHVPDVSATANWYASIGFRILRTAADGTEMTWALLQLGSSELMLNCGGSSSDADRREVDLYIHVEDVDQMYSALVDRAEVVEEPHDTFYGQREFIIRDCNRFWITFGQVAKEITGT
jgi:uncharacterized glyoxalase superfamily protein PhnB